MRQQVMVALLGPGDIVGEIGTLLDRGRSASIVALTHCEVVSIPGDILYG
ncbi:MAG: cyclic nucleotide-binding domain-containing protein [Rhodocyclaceae bacterium]|nr:cyclic nucleotide-binding domain-containing protein [Rhodocyclaceae bacterium]